MNVLKGMLGSKKWTMTLTTIVGFIGAQIFGFELSEEVVTAVVTLVVAIIAAQGAKDFAIARNGK